MKKIAIVPIVCFVSLFFGCDENPPKPLQTNTVASHQIPIKGGEWRLAWVAADGKLSPTDILDHRIKWGHTYSVESRMEWNKFAKAYGPSVKKVDDEKSVVGTSYTLDNVTKSHIRSFDAASGSGRFSDQPRTLGHHESHCEGEKPQTVCGTKFSVEDDQKATMSELMSGKRQSVTMTLKHNAPPSADTVASVK